MATDQRRFEVFVSSTYRDLQEARQRVTMTLLECDAFPSGMEMFPAADDDAWTLIRRIIDGCDYYLLVIAGKYGSVDPSSGLSYTEMEYDYAVAASKPVMAFLYKDVDGLRADQCESTDEGREKYNNFRQKVQKAKHVKYWKSLDDLPGQVALSYTKFVRDYPATGWMRADQASSTESLKELLGAKARIEELEDALAKVNAAAPSGAEDLAQVAMSLRSPITYPPYTETDTSLSSRWLLGAPAGQLGTACSLQWLQVYSKRPKRTCCVKYSNLSCCLSTSAITRPRSSRRRQRKNLRSSQVNSAIGARIYPVTTSALSWCNSPPWA